AGRPLGRLSRRDGAVKEPATEEHYSPQKPAFLAKAGTHFSTAPSPAKWIPAFAGNAVFTSDTAIDQCAGTSFTPDRRGGRLRAATGGRGGGGAQVRENRQIRCGRGRARGCRRIAVGPARGRNRRTAPRRRTARAAPPSPPPPHRRGA